MVYKTLLTQGKKVEIPEEMLKEIPYLETLFSGRFSTEYDGDGVVKSDEFDADLLRVIIRYLEDKRIYRLFACLPVDQDIVELLEMFRFLALVPPIDTELVDIKTILERMPSFSLTSQNDLVKYGFALFYSRGQIIWKDEMVLRNRIFNTMNYLFTCYNASFKSRAKYHIRKLALNSVTTFTYKQRCIILDFKINGSLDQSDTEYHTPASYDHGSRVYSDGSSDSIDSTDFMDVFDRMHRFGFYADHDDYHDWALPRHRITYEDDGYYYSYSSDNS